MERERNFLGKTRLETVVWASKLVLLVVGAVSTATLFKVVVVPYLHNLAISTVPKIWASLKASSASPLFIYLAVNLIIAAIAVTSAFNHRPSSSAEARDAHRAVAATTIVSYPLEKSHSWERFRVLQREETTVKEMIEIGEVKEKEKEKEEEKKEESWPPDSSSGVVGVGGGDGGEEEEEEEEISSMDETWKAIVAAKSGGLRRSETVVVERATAVGLGGGGGGGEDEVKKWARKEMRKWETFNDRGSKQREDRKAMSTDELSRRSEAFIKKVNDDMKLQRLQSQQRFMEMVNRGL